jgi:hypothetical protein
MRGYDTENTEKFLYLSMDSNENIVIFTRDLFNNTIGQFFHVSSEEENNIYSELYNKQNVRICPFQFIPSCLSVTS